jgi:hypothetical protein
MANGNGSPAGSAALSDSPAPMDFGTDDQPNIPLPTPVPAQQPMQQGNVPGREALAATVPGGIMTPPPPATPPARWQDRTAARKPGSFAQRLAKAADTIGVPATPGGWARSLVGAAQVALSGMEGASTALPPDLQKFGGAAAGIGQAAQARSAKLQEQQRQQQKTELEQRKQLTDEDKAHAEIALSNVQAFQASVGARKAGLEMMQSLSKMNKDYMAKIQDPQNNPEPATPYKEDVSPEELNQMQKSGEINAHDFIWLETDPVPGPGGQPEWRYTIMRKPGPHKITMDDVNWLRDNPDAKSFLKGIDEKNIDKAPVIPGEIYNRMMRSENTQKLANMGRQKTHGDMEFLKERVDFDQDPFLQQAYVASGFDPFSMVMNLNQAIQHEKEIDAQKRGVPVSQGTSAIQQKYPQLARTIAAQYEVANQPGSGFDSLAKLANTRWAAQLDLWVPKSEMEATDATVYFDKIAADNPKDAAAQTNAKLAHEKLDRFEDAQTKVRVEESTRAALANAAAKGTNYETMLKIGTDPFTKESLNLANAPDSILLGHNGEPVPIDRNKELEPTSQERQTADRARTVMAISKRLRDTVTGQPSAAAVVSNIYNNVREQLGNDFGSDSDPKNYTSLSDKAKAKVGPMVGRWEQMLAKAGVGDREAQSLLNDIIFLQSAATAMHTSRFSQEILKKMNSLITPSMNPQQFMGALDSIDNVAQFYQKEDSVVTIGDWKRSEALLGHTVMMAAPKGAKTNQPIMMVSPDRVQSLLARGASVIDNPGQPQIPIPTELGGASSSVGISGPAAAMGRR